MWKDCILYMVGRSEGQKMKRPVGKVFEAAHCCALCRVRPEDLLRLPLRHWLCYITSLPAIERVPWSRSVCSEAPQEWNKAFHRWALYFLGACEQFTLVWGFLLLRIPKEWNKEVRTSVLSLYGIAVFLEMECLQFHKAPHSTGSHALHQYVSFQSLRERR